MENMANLDDALEMFEDEYRHEQLHADAPIRMQEENVEREAPLLVDLDLSLDPYATTRSKFYMDPKKLEPFKGIPHDVLRWAYLAQVSSLWGHLAKPDSIQFVGILMNTVKNMSNAEVKAFLAILGELTNSHAFRTRPPSTQVVAAVPDVIDAYSMILQERAGRHEETAMNFEGDELDFVCQFNAAEYVRMLNCGDDTWEEADIPVETYDPVLCDSVTNEVKDSGEGIAVVHSTTFLFGRGKQNAIQPTVQVPEKYYGTLLSRAGISSAVVEYDSICSMAVAKKTVTDLSLMLKVHPTLAPATKGKFDAYRTHHVAKIAKPAIRFLQSRLNPAYFKSKISAPDPLIHYTGREYLMDTEARNKGYMGQKGKDWGSWYSDRANFSTSKKWFWSLLVAALFQRSIAYGHTSDTNHWGPTLKALGIHCSKDDAGNISTEFQAPTVTKAQFLAKYRNVNDRMQARVGEANERVKKHYIWGDGYLEDWSKFSGFPLDLDISDAYEKAPDSMNRWQKHNFQEKYYARMVAKINSDTCAVMMKFLPQCDYKGGAFGYPALEEVTQRLTVFFPHSRHHNGEHIVLFFPSTFKLGGQAAAFRKIVEGMGAVMVPWTTPIIRDNVIAHLMTTMRLGNVYRNLLLSVGVSALPRLTKYDTVAMIYAPPNLVKQQQTEELMGGDQENVTVLKNMEDLAISNAEKDKKDREKAAKQALKRGNRKYQNKFGPKAELPNSAYLTAKPGTLVRPKTAASSKPPEAPLVVGSVLAPQPMKWADAY